LTDARVTLLLAVVGIVAVGAANAPAKPGSAQARGVCNVQGIDVFFWPQGHPAIPVIGFPAFGQPHVEFHKPRDHTNDRALAADAAMPFAADATAQTASAQKIRCGLTGNVDLRLAPWTRTRSRLIVRTIRVKGNERARR
jgi:type IV secretory pathway VirB2 component (pilin)